ncbi:MAG: sigma-54-dependent Fis family transcriptional regulator [Verrucomicrobia bacterium]|nr:sigma-54-dependent Fis family transcriptional regulator [Verrucomicrobiota bacterium]MBO7391840.1 sigma-54-dependent Fis family transcriptional regulator [Verrucomicrobiota bacterium]MBO7524013.1 sigma-54-dependent Fis family transcriptional regulator [Verrucomicrobiota bacterium]MBP5760375.1 sigma-54-dependent Fis family transcriptional regulator [Verrucomicrobiota bacterium]
MKKTLPPLMIVDDERNMRLSLQTVLSDEGYEVIAEDSAENAYKTLESKEVFIIITDARLGGMSGYEFLKKVKERWKDIPVVMITGYATPKLAVDAIKSGAIDYLAKPFAPEELIHCVKRCADLYQLVEENRTLKVAATEQFSLDGIIGNDPSMQSLKELIQTVAPTDATVLILGESGTGKELIAGAIHHLSRRRTSNYVRINCAAIPEALLESELFGHEKGSFTGALKRKIGRVEEADGGTIFLDEIGDMSRPLQAKLLRFLEDGSFTRVGGNEELKVDVRLVAATNRDVIELIHQGSFREDLFHRLNVVQFRPPPLRERGGDVILLAEFFLKQFSSNLGKSIKGFTKAAEEKLTRHHWPGNVRELRNAVERAVILERGDQISPENLPSFQIESRLRKDSNAYESFNSYEEILEDCERNMLLTTLELCDYSLARAAERLKITEALLKKKAQKLNLIIGSVPGRAGR